MKRFLWPLAGAVVSGAVMFLCMLVYDRWIDASTDLAVQGFQTGRRILTSMGGAAAGLVLGVVLGCWRHGLKPTEDCLG